MSPLKTALITAASAIVLTSAWNYHVGRTRSHESARLRSGNDRMRLEASARHEARILQTHGSSVAGAGLPPASLPQQSTAQSLVESAAAPSPARQPRRESAYRNEGQATPVGALQTFAWACDQGDAALLEQMLAFDAAAEMKANAFFAALPTEFRSQWASPAAMAAAVYVSNGLNHPYPVAGVIQQAKAEPITADRVVMRLPGAGNGDGYEFQRTADGWKLAITEKVVDDYIQRSRQRAPAGP